MIEVIGKNGILVKLIKDSISPSGVRMCTFEIIYHRLIHSELMTHCALSKNSASSRAVPYKTMSDTVLSNPAIPVHWGKNQPGMIAREELTPEQIELCKAEWVGGLADLAVRCDRMNEIGLHKQVINRMQEYGTFMKTVISGTDWDNFFWLRDDEEAQPEFGELAKCMHECYATSVPQQLFAGEWHLPYIDTTRDEVGNILYLDSTGDYLTLEEAKQISASCCAQVSYRRLNDSKDKAIEIFGKLFSGRKPHMSPVQHQATPIVSTSKNVPYNPYTWELGVTHVDRAGKLHSGNLTGWIQLRNTLPNNVFTKK